MVISFLGGESLKIQFGDTVIAYNPISKDSKLKSTSFRSDIVLMSTNHVDMNGAENASRGDVPPFVIGGPGEYEVKDVIIKGYPSESTYGGKKSINTIYLMTLEGMNVCFLGALGNAKLPSEVMEDLEEVDILVAPIGGDGVLDAEEAYKLAVQLEPHIIIPVHHGDMGGKDALKAFLKEGGEDKPETLEKLTLKKKDLEGKQGHIVVLSATTS